MRGGEDIWKASLLTRGWKSSLIEEWAGTVGYYHWDCRVGGVGVGGGGGGGGGGLWSWTTWQ